MLVLMLGCLIDLCGWSADKVMSLCWHYKKENTLLFGTLTGRIGVIEGNKWTAPPRMLPSCSSRQVYWMCWGPPPPSLASHNNSHPAAEPYYVLYVVTNKKLFVYKDIYSNEGNMMGIHIHATMSPNRCLNMHAIAKFGFCCRCCGS